MGRLAYAVIAYLAFLASFVLFAAFIVDLDYFRAIDAPPTAPFATALAIDLALLAQFGVVHSLLARPRPKRIVVGIVSEPAERSTYVLIAALQLSLIVWQWRALPDVVWHIGAPGSYVVWAIYALAVALIVVATFLTDHFELFGLRKPLLAALGRPYTPIPFVERSLYACMRHPMMTGFLIALVATPTMTIGHAILALGLGAYIFVGTAFEERALVRELGATYEDYRRRVPAFMPSAACLRRRAP